LFFDGVEARIKEKEQKRATLLELLTQFLKYGDEPVTVGRTLNDNSNKVCKNSLFLTKMRIFILTKKRPTLF
jgi:hypothetical protein